MQVFWRLQGRALEVYSLQPCQSYGMRNSTLQKFGWVVMDWFDVMWCEAVRALMHDINHVCFATGPVFVFVATSAICLAIQLFSFLQTWT